METGFDQVINVKRHHRPNWLMMGIIGVGVLLVGAIFGSLAAGQGWFNGGNKVPIYVAADPGLNQQITMNGGFSAIAKAVTPAVVTVNVSSRRTQASNAPFFFDPFRELFPNQDEDGAPRRTRPLPNPREQQPRQQGQGQGRLVPSGVGSGVIVSPDGYILTNNHVVEGAEKVQVELSDRRQFTAKVIGTDPPTDVALIKIDATGLPVVPFGDSDKVEVGDLALAVGNPLGIGQTVTMGIISAKGRRSPSGDVNAFENFIQTDAAINRGNSGGALISLRGELIGIPSQILSQTGGNIGIGFAIPTSTARTVMDQLLRTGKVSRGMLGISIRDLDADLAASFSYKGTQGALVERATSGGPADQAGVKRGDIVTEFNGQRIENGDQLKNLAAQTAPGTTVKFKVWRDGTERELSAKLVERDLATATDAPASVPGGEASSAGGILSGMRVETLTPELAQRLRLPDTTRGVVISDLEDDSNAAAAGVRRGDVIEEVGNQPVTNLNEFNQALQKLGNLKTVRLSIRNARGTAYLVVKDE